MLGDCTGVVFRYLDMGLANSSKCPGATKVWCIIKEKWQLRPIGRPKVYNLFSSTLGVLQVCDCKEGGVC